MGTKKGDGSFYFDKARRLHVFRITIDGATHRRSSKDLDALKRVADELRRKARRGEIGSKADERLTVTDWVERWLTAKKQELGEQTTSVARYRSTLENHVLPTLGKKRLRDLRAQHRRDLYERLAKPDPPKRPKALHPRTVAYVHEVLQVCLNAAMREGLPVNVPAVTAVKRPKTTKSERPGMTPEQLRAFLEAAKGDRWYPLWFTAAHTGCRLGEMLALCWDCLDPEWINERPGGRVVEIRRNLPQAPGDPPDFREFVKGDKRRSVLLSAAAVDVLRRHWFAQQKEREEAGALWSDYGLVFTDEAGRAVGQHRVKLAFHRTAKRAKLPDALSPHSLRHTFANLMRRTGADTRTRMEALGHSSPAMTIGTYEFSDREMAEQAMERLADIVRGAP